MNSDTGYTAYKILDPYNLIIDDSSKYRLNKYGGNIQIYLIHCRYCLTELFEYQKDGNGPLLRCYLDRIRTCYADFTPSDILTCPCCHQFISLPISLYNKISPEFNHSESRLAYTLILDN